MRVAKALQGRDVVRLQPSGAYAANLPGFSDRVPMKIVFLTDGSPRRIQLGNPVSAATLAAAYAEAGQFPEAIMTAQRALQLATSQNNTSLVAALKAQLKLYQAGSPLRETGTSH